MRGRSIRIVIGIVGTVVLLAAEALGLAAGRPAGAVVLDVAIGLTYLYGGLAIWAHEPANRTGKLMTAVGLVWFLPGLARFEHPQLTDVGNALFDLPTVLLVALVLAYPSGRLETRIDRIAVVVLAVMSTTLNAIQLIPQDLVINQGSNGLVVGLGLAILINAVILRRWLIAPASSRRELLPVLVAGIVFLAALTTNLVRRILEVSDVVGDLLTAMNDIAPAAIPIALLIGFYRQSEHRLLALVDAIPDRIVRISDGRGTLVRGEGTAPGNSPTDGVIARTFDALTGEAGDAAIAATRRALETGTLQAFDFSLETAVGQREFEARVAPSGPDEATAIIRDFTDQRAAEAELRRSRARIVEATDAERRRLERDLHDGAQQRLVALSLSLRLLRARLEDPDQPRDGAVAAADEAATELRLAIAELRELARGIHPAILTEAGLGAAITNLAERSPVPAVVTALPDGRLAPSVESTAYFVVSESLANVAKHASATRVGISATCDESMLAVEVSDDGVGGADRDAGTGLAGLHDRVGAVGGRLTVDSPRGQGTRVLAEIPLGGPEAG